MSCEVSPLTLVVIKLKNIQRDTWALYAPKGHQLGESFHGDIWQAKEWSRQFVSGLYNCVVRMDEEKYTGETDESEKKDRLHESVVRDT